MLVARRVHDAVNADPLAGGDGAQFSTFVLNAFDECIFLDLRFYKCRGLRIQVTGLFRLDLLYRLLRDRQNGVGSGNIGILSLCDRGQAAQQGGGQSGGQASGEGNNRLSGFFGRHGKWLSLLVDGSAHGAGCEHRI